ncbi:hypothetical protein PICMEDRAFT_14700, partial [Pichia membranifaciens NRRL Y-2026]
MNSKNSKTLHKFRYFTTRHAFYTTIKLQLHLLLQLNICVLNLLSSYSPSFLLHSYFLPPPSTLTQTYHRKYKTALFFETLVWAKY